MFYEKNKDLKAAFDAFAMSGRLKYRSETMPIWCPGCGDYAIVHALSGALNDLKIDPKDVAMAAGIGCSGRTPGFLRCYGFHGVHGRVLPLATGMKLGNKNLTVIAVGGDGDGLGIGGGHLPHAARNNVDITYILFDNSIYGLTKGQTSPTSRTGTVTKTTPFGSEGRPLNASLLALSYGASFVARVFSGFPEAMQRIFSAAISHRGFSIVQALTPCVVFNKAQAYEYYYERCRPLPVRYRPDNAHKAMRYVVSEEPVYTGIFFEASRRIFGAGFEPETGSGGQ